MALTSLLWFVLPFVVFLNITSAFASFKIRPVISDMSL